MRRQVTGGRDGGFDGVFAVAGRTNVVEVKYIPHKTQYPRLKVTIMGLTKTIQQYGWTNAQIILALVFEREEDMRKARIILSEAFSENPIPVVVRSYLLDELKVKFGVNEQNGPKPVIPKAR